jgi:hypothetical protein
MADKHTDDRKGRVTVGDTNTMTDTSKGQLGHLSELDDFKIAEGEPDVRGWDVKGADGKKLGEVEDLLVDTGAMKVRYMEVTLDKDVAKEVARTKGELDPRSEPSRHVLIPIGAARLDDENDDVRLGAEASDIAGLPAYSRDRMSRDYENDVVRCFDGGSSRKTADRNDEAFYSRRQFDDLLFFGQRRKGRGKSPYFTRSTQGDAGTNGRSSSDREVRMEPVAEVEVLAVDLRPVQDRSVKQNMRPEQDRAAKENARPAREKSNSAR